MTAFPFSSLQDIKDVLGSLPQPDTQAETNASARNDSLTKPPGALGRLEQIAIWYAAWRGNARPQIAHPQVAVFAGNHGVTAQGISAFPAEVTAQMVLNFQAGGAAINQICGSVGADLTVISLDLDTPTADFSQGSAMTQEDCLAAIKSGWDALDEQADLVVPGEMGIGNTTSAAALALANFGGRPEDWAGRGTGLDDAGVAHKAEIIAKGLDANGAPRGLEALQTLGGRELAAMVGLILHARMRKVPVILDGFICSAAASCLFAETEDALDHCLAGHLSAEGAHARLLQSMDLDPILSLGLRLGEGSGGASAIAVVKLALACHSGMASFAEAGVSDG